MFQIEGLTEEPSQNYRLPIENSNLQADLTMTWRDTQTSWFMDITYGDFVARNIRMCCLPNMLNQFANRLPFGLVLISTDGQDPMTIESFFNGSCTLYILNANEVAGLEAEFG